LKEFCQRARLTDQRFSYEDMIAFEIRAHLQLGVALKLDHHLASVVVGQRYNPLSDGS